MRCFVCSFKCVPEFQFVNNSKNGDRRSLSASVVGVNVQGVATNRREAVSQYKRKGFGCTACPGFFLAPALFGRLGSELSDGMDTDSTKHSAGNDMDEVKVVARCMRGAFQYCGAIKELLL